MIIKIDTDEYFKRLLHAAREEFGYSHSTKNQQESMNEVALETYDDYKNLNTTAEEWADDIMNMAVLGTIAGRKDAIELAKSILSHESDGEDSK